jgi:hypothetical protein
VVSHSGGIKLGNRISSIVSTTIIATHQRLIHTKHKLAMLIFSDISDVISEEVHTTLGPILRQLHDDTPAGSSAHPLVKFMATNHGQFQALAGTAAGATGLFSSIAQIVNNELSPSVRGALATNPHLLPDPGTLAELAAHGLAQQGDVMQSIAEQGINTGWGNALIELNKQYPDAGTMLDMVRRGFIGRDTFLEWSLRNGVPVAVSESWVKLVDVPLTPADAALALLRGNISEAEAIAAAAAWGVTEQDFTVLVNNTGEPLGLEQLLEARRRGFINDERLTRGILQSRVRNEWIDVAKAIAFSPMSTADAVQASVQNHITQAQASAIASQNGLEPGSFDTLYQTAGEPLSRTEMEQLYNRGLATREDVLQALRESRLKDKYGEQAFELHTRLIPPTELARAVLYGTMTHEKAVAQAMTYGYSEADAATLVSSAVNQKLETQRMGVVRAVEQLYENNAMTHETATAIIGEMGFEPSEATFIIQAAEFKRQEKVIATAISAVRSKYIAHHINQGAASASLDAIGIPHQQRDFMLSMWRIEHDANVKLLTPSQIIKGGTIGIFTAEQVLERLMNLGYTQVDAQALIDGA